MERKNIKIKRDELTRLNILKKNSVYLILKSIQCNRTISPVIRLHAYAKIVKTLFFQSRVKNHCLITGRSKGTYKMFNISRHVINKKAQFGYLPGYTRNNLR